MKKDPFCPCKKSEKLLGHEVPYPSTIGAFMYLANCICLNIAFSYNISKVQFYLKLKTLEKYQTFTALSSWDY